MNYIYNIISPKKTNDNNLIDNVDNYNITNQEEPTIVVSKFDKNIEGNYNDTINKIIKNEEKEDNENNENNEDNHSIEEDFKTKFGNDNFINYIVANSEKPFTKNATYCRFNWNGIELLKKWELNRKVNIVHATQLARFMSQDYKKYGEFIFYDPIHIGKKKFDVDYYVLDGQHRLEAYLYFCEKNKYAIQQIPVIIWYAENEEHFIELFNKINSRLSIDKLKLMQLKLLEIIEGLENKYGKNIWGINRTKINKELFCNKIKNNDNAHKLTSEQILNKLFDINNNIRGKPRNSRVKPNINTNIHKSAEEIDLFLGLDRTMSWIDEI